MKSDSKSVKQLFLSLGSYLASPVMVGLLVTLGTLLVAFQYYITRAEQESINESVLLKSLSLLDQKSYDLRMVLRGAQKGSDKVGLLVVDERAVEAVGRWPWPRDITAKAIGNAIKYGAKVVGFDMVFSEASANPANDLYRYIKSQETISPELNTNLKKHLREIDGDSKFAEMVRSNADNLVLGSFHVGDIQIDDPVKSYCTRFIFENDPTFKIWEDSEEIYLGVRGGPPEIPDTLSEFYRNFIREVAEEVRATMPPPKSKIDMVVFNEKVRSEQLKSFCYTWLDPEKDPYFGEIAKFWSQIKDDDTPENTYHEWAKNFSEKLLKSAIQTPNAWVMNLESFSRAAKHTGYFNAIQDVDGTIRKSPLIVKSGEYLFPSMALKTFLVGKNYNAEVSVGPLDIRPDTSVVNDFSIIDNETGEPVFSVPVDHRGHMVINYAGKQKMFPHVSLAELLQQGDKIRVQQRVKNEQGEWVENEITYDKREFLKGKYFVLGATAIGIYDLRVTPFEENYPGAETHANVISNLLTRDFYHRHAKEDIYMFAVIILLGVFLSLSLSYLSALPGIGLTVLLIFGISVIDRHYLFGEGIIVSIMFPILEVGGLYVSMTFYKYFTEERNKKELRSTFQKYVSPAIVEEILADPSNIELGGQKQNITVFFSDIRGFTTISEKLDPKALGDLLNMYLTPMTDLVFSNRGTLDKYMGDAVMAFFGAPIHYSDHAKYACRCALQSLEKLTELQEEFRQKGLPNIDIGIGLNTGECSVGNMGSESVRSYTVMGDTVNLGSRLEGINKQYGTRIIISEFTYNDIKDDFVTREVDLVRVKGKALPVKIYELIAEGKAPQTVQEMIDYFAEGYKLYHQKKFQQAIDLFSKALNINPGDHASKLYMERCHDFLNTPPPKNWDGVFVMTTK